MMLLFFKLKNRKVTAEFDGPTWKKGDQLEALMPLTDFRPWNSATWYSEYYLEHSPVITELSTRLSPDTLAVADLDCKDAYHAMLLADDTVKPCCQYTDAEGIAVHEIQVMSQGQAHSAVVFPCWVRHGMGIFLGSHLEAWWLNLIDDFLVHGPFADRCEDRYVTLCCLLCLMNLKTQPKRSPSVSTEKVWAGLNWTIRGMCITEDARNQLVAGAAKKIGGVNQARSLRGHVQQCSLGFTWSWEELNMLTKLQMPWNQAIVQYEATGKWIWNEECQANQDSIADKLTNQPKAYCNADWVISKDRSVLALGDGDPVAVSSGRISFDVPDAFDITLDMCKDPTRGVIFASTRILRTSTR